MSLINVFDLGLKMMDSPLFMKGHINDSNVIVERNPENALHYAQEQTIPDVEVWSDLREGFLAQLNGRIAQSQLKKADLLDCWYEVSFKLLQSKIPNTIVQASDDVHHDLFCVALNASLPGEQNVFFGLLEKYYSLGGWPCGWKGEYPQGHIIVFSPA